MILPHLGGFRSEGTIVVSVRHLQQYLMDALVFIAFIPLAELLEFVKELHILPCIPLW
jgi:hypothetical protein